MTGVLATLGFLRNRRERRRERRAERNRRRQAAQTMMVPPSSTPTMVTMSGSTGGSGGGWRRLGGWTKLVIGLGIAALVAFAVFSVIGFFSGFGLFGGLHMPRGSLRDVISEQETVDTPAEDNFRRYIQSENVYNSQVAAYHVNTAPRHTKIGVDWTEARFKGDGEGHTQTDLSDTEVHANVTKWPTATDRGTIAVRALIHADPVVQMDWKWCPYPKGDARCDDPNQNYPHVSYDESLVHKIIGWALPGAHPVSLLITPHDITADEVYSYAHDELVKQVNADPDLIPRGVAELEQHFENGYKAVAQQVLDSIALKYPDAVRFDFDVKVNVVPKDAPRLPEGVDVSTS